MRKILLWLLIGVLMFSFSAVMCQAEEKLGKIRTRGPQGQIPVWYTQITLSEQEKARIREGHYRVAYDQATPNEFNDVIGKAIKYRCEELGMEFVAHTLNNLDPAKQKENIESILALHPNIIVALSVDPVTTRDVFKRAAEQGVILVFASNKPANFKWGEDYTGGLVIFDFYEFGHFLAQELNKALNGKGKIGYVYHEANFFITNQRDRGFKEALREFPGLKIVAEAPWSGNPADIETVVNAMIMRHPEINGLYIPWSEGALGAASALRAAGRPDIKIVTHDIGKDVALEMIKGKNIVALTQCKAWQYGLTAVDMGCYGILGKELPAECILIPGLVATKENIEEVWPQVFHEPLPPDLQKYLR